MFEMAMLTTGRHHFIALSALSWKDSRSLGGTSKAVFRDILALLH